MIWYNTQTKPQQYAPFPSLSHSLGLLLQYQAYLFLKASVRKHSEFGGLKQVKGVLSQGCDVKYPVNVLFHQVLFGSCWGGVLPAFSHHLEAPGFPSVLMTQSQSLPPSPHGLLSLNCCLCVLCPHLIRPLSCTLKAHHTAV